MSRILASASIDTIDRICTEMYESARSTGRYMDGNQRIERRYFYYALLRAREAISRMKIELGF